VRRFGADLHIHTALSPCAMDEMTPPAIVRAAKDKGLDMIAICDHNSAKNTAAVQEAGGDTLAVLAGIEVTTREEVHILGLFPEAESACTVGDAVAATLPSATADALARFGSQPIMDAAGRTVGSESKLLAAASDLDLAEAVDLIHAHGGLAVASHLDRPSFSVFSQLGVFPDSAGFDAIEVSAQGYALGRHHQLAGLGFPIVVSSDSHFLSELGTSRTVLELAEATFCELAMAFRGHQERRCLLA